MNKTVTLKSACEFMKTQLCTAALTLTLFNTSRLPREALKHGPVPYLVVYSFWLLVVGLPTVLLQLAMGQLSQQDPVGVWRAVPILKGVGYLRLLVSFISCIYTMMITALAAAYIIWIGKGTFPLRDCTRPHITPRGYENKMNASECFNATFLAPFTEYPQYLSIMAILIFILWFFVPILLLHMRKTLKISLAMVVPIIVVLVIVLSASLSDRKMLTSLFLSCEQWKPLLQPYIWHSALVQALLSTSIAGGYLLSAGWTVYKQSDVRWVSSSIITTNLIASWLWILFWESLGDDKNKDTSFISILVLIYQTSVSKKWSKQWPLLQFIILFFSGIITVLTLLFPIYDKLHRSAGDHWRLFATVVSAVGTAATVAILSKGLELATVLDTLVVPVLATFTTAVEVIGFVFIYGWCYLAVDIEFLTGNKLPCGWIATWWTTPFIVFGVTGWWLRSLLQATWGQVQTLWPLVVVFVAILIIMVVSAAIAVANEEQFNLLLKIFAAFRPSRLWGPEELMSRYVWMSLRLNSDTLSVGCEPKVDANNYAQIIFSKETEKSYNDSWKLNNNADSKTCYVYNKNGHIQDDSMFKDVRPILENHYIPRTKTVRNDTDKFRSPNICIASEELGGPGNCNCNRHFTLNVPDLKKNEVTTSL